MGCTHYPLLSDAIARFMGPDVKLINTGVAVADVVRDTLNSLDIASSGGGEVLRAFYTSDEPKLFEDVASPFLGRGLPAGTKHFSTDRYEV